MPAVEPAFNLRPPAKRPAECVNFSDAGTVIIDLFLTQEEVWNVGEYIFSDVVGNEHVA